MHPNLPHCTFDRLYAWQKASDMYYMIRPTSLYWHINHMWTYLLRLHYSSCDGSHGPDKSIIFQILMKNLDGGDLFYWRLYITSVRLLMIVGSCWDLHNIDGLQNTFKLAFIETSESLVFGKDSTQSGWLWLNFLCCQSFNRSIPCILECRDCERIVKIIIYSHVCLQIVVQYNLIDRSTY